MDEKRTVYIGTWPRGDHYPGERVTLKLEKVDNMEIVITETDIELGNPFHTAENQIYNFVMPDRDVHIDYDYEQIYISCPACGQEFEQGENVCPHCKVPLHEFADEIKTWHDMIDDGVLAWGVQVGRFVFEKYGKVVYAITETPHIGPSDVTVCYQISRADYDHLMAMSQPHSIPDPPIPSTITDKYHDIFLCSQSAYAKRYEFTLREVDMSLCDE